MAEMKMHRRVWGFAGFAWRTLWRRTTPECGARNCAYPRKFWSRMRRRRSSVRLRGVQYCVTECLERALLAALQSAGSAVAPRAGGHRIPLGLLLLSRQQLTDSQLRAALAAQRSAGRGRIGEWLQEMGFVNQQQITAALARQWSCPVLQTEAPILNPVLLPQIPRLLLASFQMIPVSFVAATATLHMAFADGIDYAVLYAIEQMLDCRTQACLVRPSLLRESLLALGELRSATEVVFDRVSGIAELVGIVSNYAVRVSAREIRLASCRPYNWVRLECASGQTLNLLLRTPGAGAGLPPSAFDVAAAI
jgi:Type II secretion system (T2SS), protein E, N-terminal domain